MKRRYLGGLMVVVALAAACANQAGETTQSAEGLDEVTLVLDYLMDGNKAPFVLGREKGFFEDEGIDLTSIEESGGSDEAAKLVGNGRFTFGTGYATEHAIAVDKDVPITMVANYQPLDQAVIFVREDSGIDELPDLAGKKVIIGSDESRVLLEDVLESAGVDVNAVTIEEVDAEQRNGLFLQNRADAMKGPFESIASMQEVDPSLEVKAFPFADYGFNSMGQGLIVHNDLLDENPDLVERMTRAAMKSYMYAVENPDEVLDVVPDLYPEAKPAVLETEMNIAFALLATENTMGHPFGYMAPEDWESTLQVLADGEIISGEKSPEEFYTNDFIGDWESMEPQGEFAAILGGG